MFFCFYLSHVYTKSKPLRITKEKHQRGDRCFLKAMQLKTQRKKKRKSGDSCRLIKLPSTQNTMHNARKRNLEQYIYIYIYMINHHMFDQLINTTSHYLFIYIYH